MATEMTISYFTLLPKKHYSQKDMHSEAKHLNIMFN